MTSIQRNNLKSPVQGLLIYNTTDNQINYFTGINWHSAGVIPLASKGFTTEWETTIAGESITLPLNNGNGSGFNCTVDWGDGTTSTITSATDPDRIHPYTLAGSYTIEITGKCEGWSFNNTGSRLNITAVSDWGDPCLFNGFKYLSEGFYGCNNLSSLPSGGILASDIGCVNFSSTFRGCSGLTGTIPEDIFKHHTSAASNAFLQTFRDCNSLTTLPEDLFKYNTLVSSNGFFRTFYGCSSLSTTIPSDLFRHNTLASSYSFYQTFYNCNNLTGNICVVFK